MAQQEVEGVGAQEAAVMVWVATVTAWVAVLVWVAAAMAAETVAAP